eukprot:12914031-Prorocentrum_lima.AAC.1
MERFGFYRGNHTAGSHAHGGGHGPHIMAKLVLAGDQMKEHSRAGGKRGFLMVFWNLNECFTQQHRLIGLDSPREMITLLDKIRNS